MSLEAIGKATASYQPTVKVTEEPTKSVSVPEGNPSVQLSEEVAARTVSKDIANDKDSQNDTSKVAVDAVKKAVNEMNKTSKNKTVQFGIHEETNRMTIKILDKESRKVVKEFPAEKTLDLIAKAWEIAGIMVDEKR